MYYSNRARVYFELKQWIECAKDCEVAIQLANQNVKAQILLARCKSYLAKEQISTKLAQEALDTVCSAKSAAIQQQNQEFINYCKPLKAKIKVLLFFLYKVEESNEKNSLLRYYSKLLARDQECLKTLDEVGDR